MTPQIVRTERGAVIDERVARVVAALTVVTALGVLLTGWWVVLVPLAVDFAARAGGRPHWSPFARVARVVVVPRLPGPRRPVAARPKRFAAGIGTLICGAAAVAALAFGATAVASGLVAALVAAASLEAAFALCVGCRVYVLLAAAGVVSDDCPECADLSTRPAVRG